MPKGPVRWRRSSHQSPRSWPAQSPTGEEQMVRRPTAKSNRIGAEANSGVASSGPKSSGDVPKLSKDPPSRDRRSGADPADARPSSDVSPDQEHDEPSIACEASARSSARTPKGKRRLPADCRTIDWKLPIPWEIFELGLSVEVIAYRIRLEAIAPDTRIIERPYEELGRIGGKPRTARQIQVYNRILEDVGQIAISRHRGTAKGREGLPNQIHLPSVSEPPFIGIERAYGRDPDLSDSQLVFIAALRQHDGDAGMFPGTPRLARLMRQTVRSMERHAGTLEAEGILSRCYGSSRHGTPTYELTPVDDVYEKLPAATPSSGQPTADVIDRKFPSHPEGVDRNSVFTDEKAVSTEVPLGTTPQYDPPKNTAHTSAPGLNSFGPEGKEQSKQVRSKAGPDSALGLAIYFKERLEARAVRDLRWAGLLEPVNAKALARNFKGWLADGATPVEIRTMVDLYLVREQPSHTKPVWRDFSARRQGLRTLAKKRLPWSQRVDTSSGNVPVESVDRPAAPSNGSEAWPESQLQLWLGSWFPGQRQDGYSTLGQAQLAPTADQAAWKSAGLDAKHRRPDWLEGIDSEAQSRVAAYASSLAEREKWGGGLLIAGPDQDATSRLAHVVADAGLSLGLVVVKISLSDYERLLRERIAVIGQAEDGRPETGKRFWEIEGRIGGLHKRVELLVLQDVGRETRGPGGWIENQFDQLVRNRGNAGLTTVITTSVPLADWPLLYGPSMDSYAHQIFVEAIFVPDCTQGRSQ